MTQETKHTGYRSKEYGIPTKRYCQCLELRDNQELIAKYREVHDEEHVWKEVIEGIRKVGYPRNGNIYRRYSPCDDSRYSSRF